MTRHDLTAATVVALVLVVYAWVIPQQTATPEARERTTPALIGPVEGEAGAPKPPRKPAQREPAPDGPPRLDPTPQGRTQRQVAVALHQAGRRDEWPCIFQLYRAESGWNPTAYGDAHLGGSYGLPQRHAPVWGEPEQWPWPIPDQVAWTVEYADGRYGDLCAAWDAWRSRADDNDVGGWW